MTKELLKNEFVKKISFILLSLLILVSCNDTVNEIKFPIEKINQLAAFNSYKNKSYYLVNIGDTIEIYHSTNSCCKYCQPNADKLQHLEYIGSKVVIPSKKDCEGCNYTSALLFVAKSVGFDTIKDAIIPPVSDCNETIEGLTKYIVQVK
jgi:hypothetical protein